MRMIRNRGNCVWAAVLAWGLLVPAGVVAEEQAAAEEAVYATVGDETITLAEFQEAFRAGVRRKFYHGKVPEQQIAEFQRQVGQDLVNRRLLLGEAMRLGVRPDAEWVARRLALFEERNQDHPRWPDHEKELMARMKLRYEQESILRAFEERVRNVTAPREAQVRAYYKRHPEKFTTPGRFRVSTILLKVEPWMPSDAWQGAEAKAKQLRFQIVEGADFAQLAREHSGDPSAQRGGDMGYMHRGMLGDEAQAAVDALSPKEMSQPVVLLEGVALFKLDERVEPKLNPFDKVAPRARELWQRDAEEAAWTGLIARLRAGTDIKVNEQHYLPLAPENTTGDTAGNASPSRT